MKKFMLSTIAATMLFGCSSVYSNVRSETHQYSVEDYQQIMVGCYSSHNKLEQFLTEYNLDSVDKISKLKNYYNFIYSQHPDLQDEDFARAWIEGENTIEDILLEDNPDVTPLLSFCIQRANEHNKMNKI